MQLTFLLNGNYIYYSFYAANGRVRKSTGLTVSKEVWDSENLPKSTKNKLDSLRMKVDTYVANKNIALETVYKEDIEELLSGNAPKPENGVLTVGKLMQNYLDDIKSGRIQNDGKPYSHSTRVTIEKVIWHVNAYYLGSKPVKRITEDDIKGFSGRLIKEGKSQNTVSIYSKYFLYMLRATYPIHKNPIVKESGLTVSPELVDQAIALSIEEIQKLYDLKLTKKGHIIVRDKFVYGCNVGLRYSDLNNIPPDSLQNGVLAISTRKTGATVHIPMRQMAIDLWNKYGGKFPKRHIQYVSETIKDICKEAGINEMILFTRTVGGVKQVKYEPKWKLVSSHTMRRSFCTNAYKAGVPVISIMKISGHKSEKSFLQYIRIDNKENAEILKSHAFFK